MSLLLKASRPATVLPQNFHREQSNGFFQQITFLPARSRNQRRKPAAPVLGLRTGRGRRRRSRDVRRLCRREIVDFAPLPNLSNGNPANSFRVRQLIAELLHLLSRLDPGYLCDVVVIKSLGMTRDQVKNLLLVRHNQNIHQKKKRNTYYSLLFQKSVYRN
jgi:hypothetical protein